MINALIVASFLMVSSSQAAIQTKEFKIEGQSVKTIIPEGFEAIPGLLNSPLSIISKKGLQDRRTVVSITPYGIKDTANDLDKIKKDPDTFYADKEEWLEQINGSSISYEPFETYKKDGATIYSVGIKYKISMGEFLDQTYYVSTASKELFYVKALIPLDQENAHSVEVDHVIKNLAAKN